DETLLDAIARLAAATPDAYQAIVLETQAQLGPLMARASGLIHGVEFDTDLFASDTTQGTVDALLR
ncbi:MAG: hypothetical protein ACOVOI_18685, partial [Hyphomicrobiales bacterium]